MLEVCTGVVILAFVVARRQWEGIVILAFVVILAIIIAPLFPFLPFLFDMKMVRSKDVFERKSLA